MTLAFNKKNKPLGVHYRKKGRGRGWILDVEVQEGEKCWRSPGRGGRHGRKAERELAPCTKDHRTLTNIKNPVVQADQRQPWDTRREAILECLRTGHGTDRDIVDPKISEDEVLRLQSRQFQRRTLELLSAVQCVGDPPTIHAAQSWVALKDPELSHAAQILKTLGTFL